MSDYQNWKDNQDENWRPLHTAPSNTELDEAIDKMLTWNIQGHTEPVVFQPEMKRAIKKLFQARERQLLTELKITNPGDVRTITPPITLEKGRFIVDAKGIIIAYLDQNKTNDGGSDGGL